MKPKRHAKFVVLSLLAATALGLSLQHASQGSAAEQIPGLLIDSGVAAAKISSLEANSPAAQQASFVGHKVGIDGYRSAIGKAKDCTVKGVAAAAAEAGVDVKPVATDIAPSKDQFRLSYSLTFVGAVNSANLPTDAIDQVTALQKSCNATYLDNVELAYQLGLRSSSTYVTKVSGLFTDCVVAAGDQTSPAHVLSFLASRLSDSAHPLSSAESDCLGNFPSVTESPGT